MSPRDDEARRGETFRRKREGNGDLGEEKIPSPKTISDSEDGRYWGYRDV